MFDKLHNLSKMLGEKGIILEKNFGIWQIIRL